jgi:hypothetical protein
VCLVLPVHLVPLVRLVLRVRLERTGQMESQVRLVPLVRPARRVLLAPSARAD